MPWTDDYIGLPFRPDGRDRTGLDCWGLYRLVLRERSGLDLPDYLGVYTAADAVSLRAAAAMMDREESLWTPVSTPAPFDLIRMRRGPLGAHVGCVVSPGLMLHIQEGGTSRLDHYDWSDWASRVVGFYRHG